MKVSELLKNLLKIFFNIFTGSMLGTTIFLTVFAIKKVDTSLLRQITLIAFVATLFTLIFYSKHELSRKSHLFRSALHFLLIFGLLVGSAYFFHWFSFANFYFISFFIAQFVLIYVLISISCYFINYSQAKQLNRKLTEYQRRRGEKLE
jgi:hypothetical protein